MAAKRGGDKAAAKREGTAAADALTPGPAGDLASTIEANRRTVMRIWESQGPRKAFNALIRAALPLPMTLRTASLMVRVGRAAGTQEAAGTLLEAALEDEASPLLRARLYRQLARLWFSIDDAERGREALEQSLAEVETPHWRLLRLAGRAFQAPGASEVAQLRDLEPAGSGGEDAREVSPDSAAGAALDAGQVVVASESSAGEPSANGGLPPEGDRSSEAPAQAASAVDPASFLDLPDDDSGRSDPGVSPGEGAPEPALAASANDADSAVPAPRVGDAEADASVAPESLSEGPSAQSETPLESVDEEVAGAVAESPAVAIPSDEAPAEDRSAPAGAGTDARPDAVEHPSDGEVRDSRASGATSVRPGDEGASASAPSHADSTEALLPATGTSPDGATSEDPRPAPALGAELKPAEAQGAPPLLQGDLTPAEAQRPVPALDSEVTPAEAQRPVPALESEVTPAEAQRPVPALESEVTPAEAQRPVLALESEVTPAEAQRPVPARESEVTPAEAQRPVPALESEVTPAEAQRPVPEFHSEVTPAEAQRPAPVTEEEVTPAEVHRPALIDDTEVTPAAAQRLEPDEGEAAEAPPSSADMSVGGTKLKIRVPLPERTKAKRATPPPADATPPMEEVPWIIGEEEAQSKRLSTDLFKILAQPPAKSEGLSPEFKAPAMGLPVRAPRKRGEARTPSRPELPAHDDVTPAAAEPLDPSPPAEASPRSEAVAAGRAKANWNEVTRPSAEHPAVSSLLIPLPPGARPPPVDEVTQRGELPAELAAQQISRAIASRPVYLRGHTPDVMDAPAFTDPGTILRREASFVARGSWHELAAFYRRRAERASSGEERAEYQSRLAELLETELGDAQAAAAVYGELVAAGEDFALSEQLRLLEASKDRAGARRALDAAVMKASTPEAETAALVTRGEWLLAIGEWSEAQEDFQTALSEKSDHVRALLGWTEARLHTGTQASLKPLREHLAKVPERHPERAQALKRLALLADSLGEKDVGGWAWRELYAENPADDEAARRVLEIAREQDDKNSLEALLRASLQKQPRGEEARRRREELWTLLESLGREAEALTEMRHAGRSEPGHRQAWIALFERMEARGSFGEASWALEQAATATEDESLREETWRQLARFTEQRLNDSAKALRFTARADAMKELREAAELAAAEAAEASAARADPRGPQARSSSVMTALPRRSAAHAAIPRAVVQRPDATRVGQAPEATFAGVVRGPGSEATGLHQMRASGASAQVRKSFGGGPEVARGPAFPRIKRPGETSPPPPAAPSIATAGSVAPTRIVETPVDPSLEEELRLEGLTGAFLPRPAGARTSGLIDQGLRRVREDPLQPEGYRALAEGFSTGGDGARSLLMVEIARALEGEVLGPADAPSLELSAVDREGLRHPALHGEAGELLAAVGHSFCRLYPSEEREFRGEPFRLDSGRGASAATEALLSSVRVLGIRAADVSVSEEPGPPFGVVRPDAPMIMVGRMAVQRVLPAAELRFFAGRALMSQEPDLLVLRGLRREQVVHALSVLGWALTGTSSGDEVARVRDALPLELRQRLGEIYPRVSEDLHFPVLADGARDSANRAGLVTCGAVGPALAALRSKKALEREMVELLRFAASERYFQLRQRALGRK